jgi:hypothetical protein
MAAYGVPEPDIAGVIGIDPKTLRKHYPSELKYGHVKANAKVAENLFRKATGDGREAVIAAIFWLKTRARWKESIQEVDINTSGTAVVKIVDDWARLPESTPYAAASGFPFGKPQLQLVSEGDG